LLSHEAGVGGEAVGGEVESVCRAHGLVKLSADTMNQTRRRGLSDQGPIGAEARARHDHERPDD